MVVTVTLVAHKMHCSGFYDLIGLVTFTTSNLAESVTMNVSLAILLFISGLVAGKHVCNYEPFYLAS